ncbi:MAG: lipopolysaccharide heptosyltransferase II [Nitrospirae bacterium RIFCSPLOWO2_02_FULL_62_14]|nr:MAG: lipopolysaccharide heptosyltransferase II [Nitrospirae bacterium RIFCSPLOWO2_02_FULL_62_14]
MENVDHRRILFIKPSSLGDIVHALPTLAALRRRFPQAHIAWLVKRQWAGLLERVEGLDRVWAVGPGIAGWLSEIPRLHAERFDLAVDLQGLFRSACLARLAGCPERVGFANGREGSPWFYTHQVAVPTPEMHAVDRYLLAAEALGAARPETPQFQFKMAPADREQVSAVLSQAGVRDGSPWVAMNVSARWPTKRWPEEYFAAVAGRLHQEGAGPVVLIGGPDDRADAQRVKTLVKTFSIIDVTGLTPLGLLPALLQSASVLLTNDSGPMHVAAAVGTPVVALFGPTSPVRTGPYGKGHRVLTHPLPCSPCFSRRCTNAIERECLTGIEPAQVAEAVLGRLAFKVRT